MRKGRNGFTLIELLVTIAIMISILGIAIVAFINISNRKKEEAYQNVKGQVELAAEQYFETNKYLFEGLVENGTTGEISLGKLVNDGYLNKVTDPRTGKALSYCTIIEVKKKDGAYETTLKEGGAVSDNPQDCEKDNTIKVVEAGGPDIDVVATGDKGNGVWLINNAKMKATAKTKSNGAIAEMKRCISKNNNGCTTFNDKVNYTVNGGEATSVEALNQMKANTYCYQAKNVAGKTARGCQTASVDLEDPTCTNTVAGQKNNNMFNGWYNVNTGKPTITFNGADSMSGIKKGDETIKVTNIAQGTKTYTHVFKDEAGRSKSCSVVVNYDNVAPTCKIATKTAADGANGWFRKSQVDLKITNMVNDVKAWGWKTEQWDSGEKYTYGNCPSGNCNVGDLFITAEGKRTVQVYMTDRAGNKGACSTSVKIDRTPPTCSSNNGTTSWTNQNRTITQNCQDSVSGCTANSVSKAFTTSTKTSSLQIKDNAGNTKDCNVNVYIDKNKPTCSVAIAGTKGNKVGNVQWYIKNNVTVSLKQTKASGWSPVSTYGLATTKKSTNKTTSKTLSNSGGGTYYGYVKDAAGNEAECNSAPFGVETSVTLTFDAGKTNNTTTNNDNKAVFKSGVTNICKFGSCSNIMCRTNSGKTQSCPSGNFARACKFVSSHGGYSRYFKVTAASVGTNKSVNDDDNKSSFNVTTNNRRGCRTNSNGKFTNSTTYYWNSCGSSGTPADMTRNVYTYKTPAGNTSSAVTLYVEYIGECGY